ncbi:unnamed protein product [Clonostachys byssicola]|uniref:Uncharacterized protein n=1 Tax=Clonostachys byssicola TaxID=160290 RepID=A0A9N9UF68_9HYPO|nr:unnamed protein product [Clonostachys byssicola]
MQIALDESTKETSRQRGPGLLLHGLGLVNLEVHLVQGHVHAPVAGADLPAQVQNDGDGRGQIWGVTYVESVVEGGHEGNDGEEDTDVASNNTVGALEGNELGRDALDLEGSAHANMGQADGSPDQQVGETSESQEPAEDITALAGLANEGQETECELDENAPEGTTLGVDVGEEPGGHTALGHGLHGAGRSEGAGVGDTEDGDGDDGVEDGGEDLDASVLDGKDEGGGLGVGTAGAQQTGVVRGEDEAEDEEVDDVEQGNSEEDLLASLGDGLAGSGRLSSGETNHLSTTEGEGGNDEDGAESSEAVAESARLDPVLAADVALVAGAAAVDDDTEDHEANAGEDLDEGEDELYFTVALEDTSSGRLAVALGLIDLGHNGSILLNVAGAAVDWRLGSHLGEEVDPLVVEEDW